MKTFILLLLTSLIGSILLAVPCEISYSNDTNVTNYEDCQAYSTSRFNELCCYVKGEDKRENPISASAELRNAVEEALKELDYLEVLLTYERYYYLTADWHLGQEISLCHPDDKKSFSPLSVDYCSKYSAIGINGVEKDFKCCYITRVNVDKKISILV